MKIGSHVSISKGLPGAAKEAASYGANTFMIYTGAPQNTKRKPIEDLKIEEGYAFMKAHGIEDFVVHAPYVMNLASGKDDTFNMSIEFFAEEIRRTERLGAQFIVMHPGAYVDKDLEYGINRIAEGLNQIITPEMKPVICLETMAGKGTEIGRNFEELARLIEKITYNEKIGICFDTCHMHDSGYDIIGHFDDVMAEFDKVLGLDRLKVFHINGSLNEKGKRKDRHANIGADESNPKGKDYIGLEALRYIVHHEVADGKPLILETPWVSEKENLYREEIGKLRGE